MAQIEQETQAVDPVTQSFVVDRQVFWTRFTGFATRAALVIGLILAGLWWFVA